MYIQAFHHCSRIDETGPGNAWRERMGLQTGSLQVKNEACFSITFKVATSQKISNSSSTCCVRQSTWFILRSRSTRQSRKNTRATRYFPLISFILNFYHRCALQRSTANLMSSRKKYTDAPSLPRNRWRSADSCLSFFCD